MSIFRGARFCKAERMSAELQASTVAKRPCSCRYSEGELMCRYGTVGLTQTEDGPIETSIGAWLWPV